LAFEFKEKQSNTGEHMTQKQRANYWLAICLLYPGGEKALIAQLNAIAKEGLGLKEKNNG
jgi:hypothetical protein